jgi:hypothetical protein
MPTLSARSLAVVSTLLSLSAAGSARAQAAPWANAAPAQQQVQTLWLRPGVGPDPVMHNALAFAAVPAASVGAGCRGALPAAPQQQLWVGASQPLVDVLVRANGPVTIAVRAPTGAVFCTDNFGGSEARITMRSVMAGTYLVYVGTTSAPVPYTIAASAMGMLASASVALPRGAEVVPWGGADSASAPSATLSLQGNGASLSAGAAVNSPANTQPGATAAPVGWVRVDGATPQPAAVIAPQQPAAVIAPQQPAAGIDVAPNGADTQRLSGTTRGRAALRFLGRACLGFGERAPTVSFTVRPGVAFMRVFVRSSGDTTMALRAPDGRVLCVDDTYGAHPGADLAQPVAGQWRVYVGTSVPRATLPFELTVSTRNDVIPAAGP